MPEPTVCAVMLTRDRPAMARKAVAAFRAQTYDPAKRMLIILDTGDSEWFDAASDAENEGLLMGPQHAGKTIGELRNIANECVGADIFVHWDDDDWSHPNRIAEQVQLLQSSGADVVGYREMLFWREAARTVIDAESPVPEARTVETRGEAWLYSAQGPELPLLGTSLCYWRKTWERKPFEPTSRGEDRRFTSGLKCVGVSGLDCGNPAVAFGQGGPAMIARIHPGNTSSAYRPEEMRANERQGGEWRRVPQWDAHCRSVMEGA